MVAKRLQMVASALTWVHAWGKKVFEKRIKITYDYYPDTVSLHTQSVLATVHSD